MPRHVQSKHTNQRLLERVKLMKATVVRRMAATQKIYMNYYDKKVCREPQIHVGDEVYIDRPQYDAFASNSAKAFAQE